MFRQGVRRRLSKKDVRVGTTKAKRIDARDALAVRFRKGLQNGRHSEFQGSQVDVWIRRLEMQAWRNLPMLQYQQGLDQTGDSGRGLQVSQVRLDGSNGKWRFIRAFLA